MATTTRSKYKTTPTSKKPRTKTTAAELAPKASSMTDVELGPEMKKKELIDAVVSRSGIKKKDAKPVVEAMLAVLGEALADSRELNLKPFGKVKVNRTKEVPNGKVIIAKVRQTKPPSAGLGIKKPALTDITD